MIANLIAKDNLFLRRDNNTANLVDNNKFNGIENHPAFNQHSLHSSASQNNNIGLVKQGNLASRYSMPKIMASCNTMPKLWHRVSKRQKNWEFTLSKRELL